MTILFWLYRSRINKSGTAPIMMRITINGKRISFSTNIFVNPASWDQNKQKLKGSSSLTKEYNNTLLNFASSAWNAYNEAIKKNIPVVPEMIKNTITNKSTRTLTLLDAIGFQIRNLNARVGHDISANTVKKYITVEKKIKQFLLTHYKKEDFYLHELNCQFISEFDSFMRINEKLKQNAIIKNMQQLRHVISISIENEWMERNPFTNYSFKMSDTERGYLTANEVTIIESILMPNKRLDQTRDVFIFCCYTGLAYADVAKLNRFNLETDSSGIETNHQWVS